MAADPKRLKSQLLTTQLANKDQPLFQLLNNIIDFLGTISSGGGGGGGGGGGTSITNITNIISGGPPGIDGDSGEDGSQGPPGIAGAQGTTGSQGPIGPVILVEDGLDGLDGMTIPVQGPQGIQGNVGPQGPKGDIILPFDPDESDLILVPGPTGPIGVTGSPGPIGGIFLLSGEDGEDGIIGPPGPAGADGTNGSSSIILATINLTDAQIRTANTVPITIIAAPGAGFVLIPIVWNMNVNVTATFSGSPTFSLQWATAALNAAATSAMSLNTTGKKTFLASLTNQLVLYGSNNIENNALRITSNGNITGGTTSGGMQVYVAYYISAIP